VVAPQMETQKAGVVNMPCVAVVILNYNGKAFLEKFLPKVIEHSKDDAEIIVADNASTDGSLAMMAANFPKIRVIKNPANKGFSNGYNLALKQVQAEYFVLLNSDIAVTPNWINPLIEFMESDKQIAACQPKILDFYNQSLFEYAGAGGGFIDKYGYPFCRGRLFQSLEADTGQYDNPIEVFWASGACMFVRSSLFVEYGGFDDDFFAHMEEIDFCWRLKNAGYKIMYVPFSKVYHIGGGTLPKKSSHKTYLNFRNNLSLLYKNLPDRLLLYVIIARLFLDIAASLKFLIEGGLPDFFAVLRAHLHFYKKIPHLRKKRNKFKRYQVSGIYKKNIAVRYFLLRKRKFSQLNHRHFS
jgi:GT2 family glycosyltransferase